MRSLPARLVTTSLAVLLSATAGACDRDISSPDQTLDVSADAFLGHYTYVVTDPCAVTQPGKEPASVRCIGSATVFAGGLAITTVVGDSIFGVYTDQAAEFRVEGQVRGTLVTFAIRGRVLKQEHEGTIDGINVQGDAVVWYSGIRQAKYPFRMVLVKPLGSRR